MNAGTLSLVHESCEITAYMRKILFVGHLNAWMGIHLKQFVSSFSALNHQTSLWDYQKLEDSWNPFHRSAAAKSERLQRRLKDIILEEKPDLVFLIISHLKIDFARLREYFHGQLVVYDMDGPDWKCYEHLAWTKHFDMLFTASKVSWRQLQQNGIKSAYLPHGIDVHYFRPLELSPPDQHYYGSPISFVGRPTPRRVQMLAAVAPCGLTLWGRRWHRRNECDNPELWRCVKEKNDIIGKNVLKIYNASTLFVNTLRDALSNPPTIMSLQVFTVPSCGGCLLTEWVEELEEAFDPGKELLVFHNIQELKELAERYTKDIAAAKKIGLAGRKRCLAEHTHEHRAKYILQCLE